MSPLLAAQIFTFLQKEKKPVYKAAIQGLANQRNLRAVFIERKLPAERFPWMQKALGPSGGAAEGKNRNGCLKPAGQLFGRNSGGLSARLPRHG